MTRILSWLFPYKRTPLWAHVRAMSIAATTGRTGR